MSSLSLNFAWTINKIFSRFIELWFVELRLSVFKVCHLTFDQFWKLRSHDHMHWRLVQFLYCLNRIRYNRHRLRRYCSTIKGNVAKNTLLLNSDLPWMVLIALHAKSHITKLCMKNVLKKLVCKHICVNLISLLKFLINFNPFFKVLAAP